MYVYKGIVGHVGPIKPGSKNYKGSSFNLNVEWMDGNIMKKALRTMAKDDPVSCARWA